VRPEDLGAVPGNVTVRAWVDQAAVVPQADLVVHHGGSGTTLGALAAGVPQLVLPQGADQFANAEALLAAGAAVRLLPGELSADAVTEQARKASSCRDAARVIAAEIAAMPAPDEVARERLPEVK
jgi:UDP:flavonoid glycosyltransferase YjiC (YdhE family)